MGLEPQILQHGIMHTPDITQDFGQLYKPDITGVVLLLGEDTQDFGQLSKPNPTQGRSVFVLIGSGIHPIHMNVPKHFGHMCDGCGSHLKWVWSLKRCSMVSCIPKMLSKISANFPNLIKQI